jgi:predicted PurR-regulated permease PerM
MSDPDGLGFRFYARVAGVIAAIGLGIMIVFLFVTRAIFAWGILGAFAAIAAVVLLVGWISDRRESRRRLGEV